MTTKTARPTTMADIAREARVSVPTVSYILNGRAAERGLSTQTVERVQRLARELGYVRNGLASNLRRRATTSIGLLVSDLERSWASRLLRGMTEPLDAAGYLITLSVHNWDPARERRELEAFLEEKKAAIITRPLAENVDVYRNIVARGVPLVFLDALQSLPNVSTVMWDPREAIRTSIRGLAAAGRRRIGYVGVMRGTREEEERFETYLFTLKELGLPFRPEWACLDKRYALEEDHSDNRGRVRGYGAELRRLFRGTGELPDALLASNDAIATMCLSMLREDFGLSVPEDVAVMGMGNSGESAVVGLSTSVEPLELVGRVAGETVLRLIEGGVHGPIHEHLEHTNVFFRSTTPVPPARAGRKRKS